ncbi:MAG TPA: hypothetical protein VN203_12725, partial [Candidatus Acidoferrum sp.]|nr:hypothetical protein [Candidatus Acidoferrum sp.]
MDRIAREISKKYQPLKDRLRFSFFLLRRRKSPLVGLAIIIFLVAVAILAPVVAPYGADHYTETRLSGPSWQYPFGVDHLGRDQLSRILYGSRISVQIG